MLVNNVFLIKFVCYLINFSIFLLLFNVFFFCFFFCLDYFDRKLQAGGSLLYFFSLLFLILKCRVGRAKNR